MNKTGLHINQNLIMSFKISKDSASKSEVLLRRIFFTPSLNTVKSCQACQLAYSHFSWVGLVLQVVD